MVHSLLLTGLIAGFAAGAQGPAPGNGNVETSPTATGTTSTGTEVPRATPPGQAPVISDTMGVEPERPTPSTAASKAKTHSRKKHQRGGSKDKTTEPARDEATRTGG